ncbi:MAG TPA: protein glxC [Verrucomicrobiae bacterium]|jgi:glutamate synthase domain-containing protein 3
MAVNNHLKKIDLAKASVRELNQTLHNLSAQTKQKHWRISNPRGAHAIACGLDAPMTVEIDGHVGYYCAGMNQLATVIIHGNTGVGVAENMMSGLVHVKGNASQSAGSSAHGGLLIIDGDASARCGISMKGIDIVVKGSVGHASAFMAQAGNLVVCGNAGEALGDSIYEARIFVHGKAKGLGSDCVEKEMQAAHLKFLGELFERAKVKLKPREFRRYGSARQLYNFHVEHVGKY